MSCKITGHPRTVVYWRKQQRVGEKETERWGICCPPSREAANEFGRAVAQDLKQAGAVAGVMRVQPASIIEEPRSRGAAMARVSVNGAVGGGTFKTVGLG